MCTRSLDLLREAGICKTEFQLLEHDWREIATYHKLSIDFIIEFSDCLSWRDLSVNENLSDDVIRRFQDQFNWSDISRTRNFSEEFILEFKNKINWEIYFYFQNARFTTIKHFISKTSFAFIDDFRTFHLNPYEVVEIEKILEFKYLFKI